MRNFRVIATFAVAMLAIAACSSGGSGASATIGNQVLKPIRLQLQWVTQAQFAGYFAAVDKGFYEDAGPRRDDPGRRGRHRARDRRRRRRGRVRHQLGPAQLAPREAGADVVDHRPGLPALADAAGDVQGQEHHQARGLRGKKIGNWGFGNEFEVFAGMPKAGIDPATRRRHRRPAVRHGRLARGEIDAAEAMTYNEYAQVLETINPGDGQAVHAR